MPGIAALTLWVVRACRQALARQAAADRLVAEQHAAAARQRQRAQEVAAELHAAAARQRVLDRAVSTTDDMSGPEFEQLVARLLRRSGWSDVVVSGGANDRGADITARNEAGQLLAVQCKRYGKPIGSEAMQAFRGTHRSWHRADVSWFVTTSTFTREGPAPR